MQGEIGVHSEAGLGSSFWLTLEAAEAEAELTASPAAPAAAAWSVAQVEPPVAASVEALAALAATPHRVLYIEDNPINTLLMAAMLGRLPGVELSCASLAEEGLALAIAEPPALILADIQMPGMDGYGLLRCLQAEPRTRHIPVIAVSANAMPQDQARGLAAGFVDYLTKPLDLHRLLAAVSAALAAGASRP